MGNIVFKMNVRQILGFTMDGLRGRSLMPPYWDLASGAPFALRGAPTCHSPGGIGAWADILLRRRDGTHDDLRWHSREVDLVPMSDFL